MSQSNIQILYSLGIMIFGSVLTGSNWDFQEQIRGPWSVYQIYYTASHFNLPKMVGLLCK